MSRPTEFVSTTPVLASLDIGRSVDFFVGKLGFSKIYSVQGGYGIVNRGAVSIHFWACTDPGIPKATSCRVRVRGIDGLYERCRSLAIVHPEAPLEAKPWGSREFGILDVDGHLVTFQENTND